MEKIKCIKCNLNIMVNFCGDEETAKSISSGTELECIIFGA
jgi:hypothetical protein